MIGLLILGVYLLGIVVSIVPAMRYQYDHYFEEYGYLDWDYNDITFAVFMSLVVGVAWPLVVLGLGAKALSVAVWSRVLNLTPEDVAEPFRPKTAAERRREREGRRRDLRARG